MSPPVSHVIWLSVCSMNQERRKQALAAPTQLIPTAPYLPLACNGDIQKEEHSSPQAVAIPRCSWPVTCPITGTAVHHYGLTNRTDHEQRPRQYIRPRGVAGSSGASHSPAIVGPVIYGPSNESIQLDTAERFPEWSH